MSTTRRTYSKEFKQEALALLSSSGKSMWALEQELGLSHGLLRQWKQQAAQAGEQAFPGHGNLKADEAELRRLRRGWMNDRASALITVFAPAGSVGEPGSIHP